MPVYSIVENALRTVRHPPAPTAEEFPGADVRATESVNARACQLVKTVCPVCQIHTCQTVRFDVTSC